MPKKIKYLIIFPFFFVIICILSLSCTKETNKNHIFIGDEPSIKNHLKQQDIESGKITIEELILHGEKLFTANFNSLDGFGRPQSSGNRTRRDKKLFPENFNRISGPETSACSDCHNMPIIGGGGSNVTNVFSSAEKSPFLDFETEDLGKNITLKEIGNERNTLGMFGSGLVELLAREMSKELIAQRASAEIISLNESREVRIELITKEVSFGFLTAKPNGTLDTSEIVGVDKDLIIKPFTQKGVVPSLRVFTNNAMNHHHGMQSSETFEDREDTHKAMDLLSDSKDHDGDGVINELTMGDITALTIFQALLPIPKWEEPNTDIEKEASENGQLLFSKIGCSDCHRPYLPLKNTLFSDPGPFNPKDHLSSEDTKGIYVDLKDYYPNLKINKNGELLVPLFSDLKRHKMGDLLNNEKVKQLATRNNVPTDQWITKKLWGFASEPPFLHHGRATLISEAIKVHGGAAENSKQAYIRLNEIEQAQIVEYLNTFKTENIK
ncbi:MAG: hypothetical protein CL764_04340 [Chloroflexi bacterium]|nr:hypothetical protein [Chloroflexota bacterium]|tara:strand:+ start:715 stop:2202 length:1488 start_codon:yes stop_codon:yes gene_type:complete